MRPRRALASLVGALTALAALAGPVHAAGDSSDPSSPTAAEVEPAPGDLTRIYGNVLGPDGTPMSGAEVIVTRRGETTAAYTAFADSYGYWHFDVVSGVAYDVVYRDPSGQLPALRDGFGARLDEHDADPYCVSTVTMTYGPAINLTAPKILGAAQVGSTLRADVGTWAQEDLTYEAEWFSGGKLVGYGPTMHVYPSMIEQTISMRVRGGAQAWTTTVASAGNRVKVGKGRSTTAITGPAAAVAPTRVTVGVKVYDHAWDRPGSGNVRVLVDGRKVTTGWISPIDDGRARLRLPLVTPGRHTVTVVYPGDEHVARSRDSVVIRVRR